MKRKLRFLAALAVTILCTGSAWAQSAISVGTNLDFSEGTPVDNGICTYAKDMAANNTSYSQMLEVTGWTLGVENGDARAGGLFAYGSDYWLGGTGYNAPATNPEGVAEGNTLGVVAVWGGTVQYVQEVTLEAGDYVISIPVYNAKGGTTAPTKSLIGFIADNGAEYFAPAKAYAVDAWTVENIKFTLTEATSGKLSLGYTAPNSGSGANQHLFFDKVEIFAVTEADLARIELNAALVSAQATVDAKVGVGAGVFMYSEEAYNAYAAAVAAAKAVSEDAEASKEALVEALAALNAATEAYAVTIPAADAVYTLKFNGTENYLTIGESNITIEATDDPLSFEAVGNGKYYIHDKGGKYLSYKGSDRWTMVASADVKDEWTVSVNAEGLYTLTGKNGGLGVDGTEAGASCYGDKNGAAVALWAIAEIVIEEEPVDNDYTSYIVNADLSTADAWNTDGTKGISGGMVKVASESAFDFNQTITLPVGQYKVTAKAAYRYTGTEQEEYDAIQAGTETHLVKLYAETASYKYEANVQNRYEGASETDYAAGNGSVTVNGKFVPNSSAAVQAWFNNDQYVNELVFNVQEDGQIKIGITRIGGIAGDYTNIGAWTLIRLGEAEADPKEENPTIDTLVVNNFLAAYSSLELLTENCPSMWMIAACNEKFNAIQEPAYAMKEAIMETPADTLVKYTAVITETVEFIMAMDAKYNAWKSQLMVAYDYQDNSTADSVARAAFDEVVDIHMGYQWMMPAASVAELDALIDELDEACIIYASQATANEGFDFGLMEVESPWAGVNVADSLKAYLYNTAANAFLAAGNSWGTQASFTETGIEWLVEGADKLYTLDGPIKNNATQHYFTGTYTDGNATQVRVRMVAANVFTLKVGDKYIAYDGTNIVANVAELSEACYWQFVTKAERQGKYASATALNPADATFEIAGANFGRNDGNNKAWAGSPAVGGENNNMCAEKWNAGIVTVSQVLTNMPSGVYRMSAQGFYRMGGVDAAAEARANGTEVLHAKFFANGDSINVMSVMEEAGKVEGVGANYNGFGQAPNSMGEASKFFSAGLYEHSLVFELAEGVDTIALGATKTGSVGADWLIFDNFRLEYLGTKNDVDYMGSGILTSVSEGNHYVFYTDAEGNNHFLNAAGQNNWVVSDDPITIAFSAGNITDAFAGAASFMASNGFYMSNAANSDGSGAIKTEAITGSNGQNKRTWESQVFYKNAAGKYAIRLTNSIGTSWGANCFVNIDPTTFAVASGQPSLGDALYLWEIADEDDPRFSNKVIAALIEKAEAITAIYNKEVKAALDAVVAAAKVAAPSEVMVIKAQLEEAIAAAQASVAEYEAIARQLAVSNSVLVSTAFGYDDFAAAVAAAEATYADSTATAEALTVLAEATASYLAANEVEGIVNGDFANGTTGWTGAMGTGNHNKWTNVNDQFVEKWTAAPGTLADMDFYQEISGLPAGTYSFAAYVSACQQANDDSYEVTGVKLYANGDSVAVHTINIDRDAANKAIGAELVMVTTTIADGETLKIGMNIASTDANWVVMDNAKLYNFDNPCLKTYEVVLEDVKVTDWAVETVISAEVMAEIVELLGAPASELTYQLVDTTGVHANYNGNAGEVLFWVDLEGNLSNWGVNNKFFLKYDAEAQTITSTQYAVAEGDVLNATLRLANAEGKYVVIKLTESIFVSPVINIEDYEVVSTITVNHVEATGVTYSGNTASFDPISTAAALGVASLDEAEQYILNVTTGNLVANTTDGWRDANGDAAKWGTTGGVCVKIQKPSSGSIDYIGCIDTTHQHGEVYTAKWAFVHEGKAVVIEVVIVFETAGIENIETLDNAVIYTISGTRVQGDVKSLERGIYIVNGKKVFVK